MPNKFQHLLTGLASVGLMVSTDVQGATSQPMALEEIIVTALKRGDRDLVGVAAGIASINGNDIESLGADSLNDFLQTAPGASIDSSISAGTTSIQVRGVNATFGAASVGFYQDDLPISFLNINFLPDPSPYDLKSVEVLKGPQGALYGAGAAGGVVLVRTNDPVLNEFSGKFDIQGSSTHGGGGNSSTSAAVNIPLVEDVAALRTSITYQDKSGWTDDTFDSSLDDLNSEDKLNGRVKLLVTPSEELSITALGAWSRIENDFGGNTADGSGEFPISLFGYRPNAETEYNQYGLVLTYDFGSFVATNSLGYIDLSIDQTTVYLAPVPLLADIETVANEFRLNSTTDGPFSWVAGVYYRETKQDLFNDPRALGIVATVEDSAESEQYSVFGEGAYRLLDDRLELTLGISRFNDDTENESDLSVLLRAPGAPPMVKDTDTQRTSLQASIAYHPTGNSTLYARYAEGFRAGIIDFGLSTFLAQMVVPSITGLVDPEDITAYELGAKGEFFDGKLYAEVALFYNEIDDIQQSAAVFAPGSPLPANTVINAGEAETLGIEWLLLAHPTERLSITFSGAYTEAEIAEDFFAPVPPPIPNQPVVAPVLLFAEGTRLNLVPELTVNGSLSYAMPLGSTGYQATGSVNVQYSSDRALTLLASPSLEGDDIVRTNLRLEVQSDDWWSVYLFANNVFDEDGAISPDRSSAVFAGNAVIPPTPLDGIAATRLRPRTFGLGLRATF